MRWELSVCARLWSRKRFSTFPVAPTFMWNDDNRTNGHPLRKGTPSGKSGVHQIAEVDPAHTPREYHACGHRYGASKRCVFRGSECGLSANRDLNAATNIRRVGNLALASGKCRDGEIVGTERHGEADGYSGL